MGRWEGQVVSLVNRLDCALEAAEKGFGADEGGGEVDCAGEFVDLCALASSLSITLTRPLRRRRERGREGGTHHTSTPHQTP
jgi:hypothetical protein